jgi:hypothetical protein
VTGAISRAIGATVCGRPYLLGRLGQLILGSLPLGIPGIVVFATGITLQTGATAAVRAIKMSAKLGTGDPAGVRSSRASGSAFLRIAQLQYRQPLSGATPSMAMSASFPNRIPDGLAHAGRSAARAIAERDDDEVKALLSALLAAAWPSLRAQNQ